jgi:hypothetical protein
MNLAEAAAILRRWSPRRVGGRPLGSTEWQRDIGVQLESLFDWLLKRRELDDAGSELPAAFDALPAASLPHAAVVMASADLCGASPDDALQVALLSVLLHAALLSDDAVPAASPSPQRRTDDDHFAPALWRARVARTLLAAVESHNPGDSALQGIQATLRPERHATVLQPALQGWVWQCTTPLARFRLDSVVDRCACIDMACADMVLQCSGRIEDPGMGVALRVFAGRLGAALLVRQLHELRRVRALRQPAPTAAWHVEHRAFASACQRATSVHIDAAVRAIGALPVGPVRRAGLRTMCDRWRVESLAALHANDAALMPTVNASGPAETQRRFDNIRAGSRPPRGRA